MDNATFQRIKDLILKHQDVAVFVKSNPSLDEMAAGLGLYLVLKQMGKNALIACPTDPVVAVSSLVGIDKVQKQVSSGEGGDLTVSFPYKEGEIDKVSYTLENGQLNIVVKAGEKGLSFNQQDVMFQRSGGKAPSLVFCVGVAHLSDVAGIYTPTANEEVINIDNKADNERYGTTVVVDTKWSSVSEQVADFVTLLEPQIELDADTAQNLLDGIDFATSDFTSPKTSYLAFEVAGILMKKGATRQKAQRTGQVSQSAPIQNVSQYFPPQPQQQQQQYVAPQAPMQQQQPVQSQPTWQAPVQPQPVVQQPVQQQPMQSQPVQPQPVQPQQQQTSQPSATKQAPPDWLTPKVYKGSTVL